MDGAVIVTTPQDVAILDSRKSINFARQLEIPVLGVVENMSGFICPHCDEEVDLFGKGGGERSAGDLGVPFLGQIPLDPRIVKSGDQGRPYIAAVRESPTGDAIRGIVTSLEKRTNSVAAE
jgi:Mrp family chromosome partitioning ATPase